MKKLVYVLLLFLIFLFNKNGYTKDNKNDNFINLDIYMYFYNNEYCKIDISKIKKPKRKWCYQKPVKCMYRPNDNYYKYKYFIKARMEYYFGLLNEYDLKIVYSLIACESRQRHDTISVDNGYGFFQLTNIDDNHKVLEPIENIDKGINHLYKVQKISDRWFKKHNIKNDNIILQNDKYFKYINVCNKIKNDKHKKECYIKINKWWLTLRIYNGGYKWIKRYYDKYDGIFIYNDIFVGFQGCISGMSEITGRFICFEKINSLYPVRIFLTQDIWD